MSGVRTSGWRRASRGPYLEVVVPGLYVGDVDPLAIDVCIVRVIAAWAQALGEGTGAEVGCCALLRQPPHAHFSSLGPPSSVLCLCFPGKFSLFNTNAVPVYKC